VPRTRHARRSSAAPRALVFGALALGIVVAALYLARPKELAYIEFGPSPAPSAAIVGGSAPPAGGLPGAVELTMRVDMAGFTPPMLDAPAGRAIRLKLVNPDNNMHTDGGGVHGFTVPSLGLDVKVPPLTTMVVNIPAAPAGEYAFYCDTCCGGKENPAMNGVIHIGA